MGHYFSSGEKRMSCMTPDSKIEIITPSCFAVNWLLGCLNWPGFTKVNCEQYFLLTAWHIFRVQELRERGDSKDENDKYYEEKTATFPSSLSTSMMRKTRVKTQVNKTLWARDILLSGDRSEEETEPGQKREERSETIRLSCLRLVSYRVTFHWQETQHVRLDSDVKIAANDY